MANPLDDPNDPLKLKPAVQPTQAFLPGDQYPDAGGGMAGQITTNDPGTPAPAAPAQAGQFANNQQGFLDWATQKYGADPTRGSGFVNAQAGGGLESMLKAYAAATGNTANYQGGPSGDRADFGQGMQDTLTSGGQIWAGGSGTPSVAPGGAGGNPQSGTPSMPYAPQSSTYDPSWDVSAPAPVGDIQGPSAFTPMQAGSVSATGAPSAIDTASRQAILNLMQRSQPGAIDVNTDPNLAPQSQAYASARNRQATQQRGALAERAAASGLNSGGQGSGSFDTGLSGIYESAGRDIAGNDASLVGGEVAARRADLMQSLSMAQAVGARDEADSLQREIANLDSQYRTSALNQQGTQANQQLNLQTAQTNQQGKLTSADQALRAALANQMARQNSAQLGQQGQLGNRGLDIQQLLGEGNLALGNKNADQNASQWDDQYGLNKEQLLYGMDRDSILQAMLGGGS